MTEIHAVHFNKYPLHLNLSFLFLPPQTPRTQRHSRQFTTAFQTVHQARSCLLGFDTIKISRPRSFPKLLPSPFYSYKLLHLRVTTITSKMCDWEEFQFLCGHHSSRLLSHCHFARTDPYHQCFGVKVIRHVWQQDMACQPCLDAISAANEAERKKKGNKGHGAHRRHRSRR